MDKDSKKLIENKVLQLFGDSSIYEEDFKILSAVGGSARAALNFYKDYYKLEDDTRSMDVKEFDSMVKDLIKKSDKKKMCMILDIKPDRIHTLLPGMIILNEISKFFNIETINVSQTGVREGYVYSKLLGRK